jgi:sugar phosphate permease
MKGIVKVSQSKPRYILFVIFAIGYFFVYFHRVSLAVMAPDLSRAFNVSGWSLGILASAYFYLYAVMQVPVGFLTDSLGSRKTVTVSLLAASVGSFLFGVSSSVTVAIVARILIGLGLSAVFVSAMKVFAELYAPQNFATMTGLLMAIGSLGWLFASSPLALLTEYMGWRMVFLLVAFVTFIIALFSWILIEEGASRLERQKRTLGPGKQHHKFGIDLRPIRTVLTEKKFWPPALWMLLSYGAVIGFGGLWGGPYLMEVYNLSKGEAGNVLMMVGLGMMAGGPISGWVSDKLFHARKPVVWIGAFLFILPWAVLVLETRQLPIFVLSALVFSIGFFDRAANVVLFAYNKELFPKEIAGTATGILNMFPFAGGAIFPTVMGYLMDKVGKTSGAYSVIAYKRSFIFCLSAAIVGLIFVLFMKEKPLENLPNLNARKAGAKT